MDWHHEIEYPEEGNEDFFTIYYAGLCNEKKMFINVLYESQSQATVEAVIVVPDQENEKLALEYYYKRTFIGIGEDLLGKIKSIVRHKKLELEIIACEQDSKIMCENKI